MSDARRSALLDWLACATHGAHEPAALPHGSPGNPLDEHALRAKVRSLTGSALDGALDDCDRPAADVQRACGLGAGPLSRPAPAGAPPA